MAAGFDHTTGEYIEWKRKTFVEIEDLIGDEYFIDLTEFASESARRARPGGYKYRLVSTLDHTRDGLGEHYTANCYRPVKPEKPEEEKAEPARADAENQIKWYHFDDLSVK